MQFLRIFYGLLLNLFPRTYREEYGEELQVVFDLSLEDARKMGEIEFVSAVFRELLDLPGAIIYEHLREMRRKKMTGKPASRFDFEPGSQKETFAALAPFLLFGALPVLLTFFQSMGFVPLWIEIVFVVLFWLSGLGLFVIGFGKGAPRWFMPYLGLPLPIIALLIFNGLMDPEWRGFSGLMQSPWFVRQFVYAGLLWGLLILLVILLVLIFWLTPGFRPFYQRIRNDWTLFSFVLYGAAPFALILSFDDYQNEEPYLFLSFLILAVGGRFYLRNRAPWKRFWSLFIGLALSMFTAAIGKGILYAGPWPRPKYFTWQTEMLSTIVVWMWLALIMFLPLALNLLPRSKVRTEGA